MQSPSKMMKLCLFIFVAATLSSLKVAGVKHGTPSLTVVPDPADADAGITVKFTCVKNFVDTTNPTVWEFYIAAMKLTDGVSGAVLSYVAVTGDNGKAVTCKAGDGTLLSDASVAKTLTVTAIPPPILRASHFHHVEMDGKVRLDTRATEFTCTKGATAKQDPVSYKFYEGASTEITLATPGASNSGGMLTIKPHIRWDGKVIKCTHFNSDAAKTDSTTTLEIIVPQAEIHGHISRTDTTASLHWYLHGYVRTFDHYRLSIIPSAGVTISRPVKIPSVETRGDIDFSNLTPMTQYNISLRTVVQDGVEGRLYTNTFTTFPGRVTNMTVSSITTTGAVVTWGKPDGKVDYYLITCREDSCNTPSDFCDLSCPVTRPGVAASDSNLQTSVTFRTPGINYTVSIFTVYNNTRSFEASHRFSAKPPVVNQTSISMTNISAVSATVKWDTVYVVIGGSRQEMGKYYLGNYRIGVKKTGTASEYNDKTRATSYDINDLIPGTDYTITIQTYNGVFGATVSKAFSTAPADIVISAISKTNALASWIRSAGIFDYYHISIQETYQANTSTCTYSKTSYRGETTDPTSVPASAESPSVRLLNLTPYTTYRVFVWTVKGTTKGPIRSSLYFKTDVPASDWSTLTGVAVSVLVLVLIATIVVIVVIVIIQRRNAGNTAATDSNGIKVSNNPVTLQNIAYEADQEPTQSMTGDNDIHVSEISEFRDWLLSQQVTEATYATLEKEGLHDPGIFANMKPDQVSRLSIKPLGQEFLIQKIAEGFNQGRSPFLARNRGNMTDSDYDDVESNFNPYTRLQLT